MKIFFKKYWSTAGFLLIANLVFAQNSKFKVLQLPNIFLNKIDVNKSYEFNSDEFVRLDKYLAIDAKNSDQTTIIQNLLNKYKKVILPNYPIYINSKGLTISSNSTLIFLERSKLISLANSLESSELLRIHQVENVKIYNANLVGERKNHIGSKGEWGHGISIRGSRNVEINNFQISDFWGDGIYIGGSSGGSSNTVNVNNGILNNCRRNGISVTSGVNIELSSILAANSNGTSPMYGVDIEPNSGNDEIRNINLSNIMTYNNQEGGILIGLNKLTLSKKNKNCSISINDVKDIGSKNGIYFGNINDKNNVLFGQISISGVEMQSNLQPMLFKSSTSKNFKIKLKNIKISQPKNVNYTENELRRVLKSRKDVEIDL